eukprot:431061-Rhodomonas_salina.1
MGGVGRSRSSPAALRSEEAQMPCDSLRHRTVLSDQAPSPSLPRIPLLLPHTRAHTRIRPSTSPLPRRIPSCAPRGVIDHVHDHVHDHVLLHRGSEAPAYTHTAG